MFQIDHYGQNKHFCWPILVLLVHWTWPSCWPSPSTPGHPLNMLNNFCFHVYAQKSLFIAENCNAFFDIVLITLSCEFGVHRAGSQQKIWPKSDNSPDFKNCTQYVTASWSYFWTRSDLSWVGHQMWIWYSTNLHT